MFLETWIKINKLDAAIEHCYGKPSSVPSEMVRTDDIDFAT